MLLRKETASFPPSRQVENVDRHPEVLRERKKKGNHRNNRITLRRSTTNESKLRSSVWLKLKSLFLFVSSPRSQSNIIRRRITITIILLLFLRGGGVKGQCIIPGRGEHFDANRRLECARRVRKWLCSPADCTDLATSNWAFRPSVRPS